MVTDQKLKVNASARLQELNLAALAPTNAAEFRHPLTLLRLAHFVRDATKVRWYVMLLLCGLLGGAGTSCGALGRGAGGLGSGVQSCVYVLAHACVYVLAHACAPACIC
jgi:hypothetical protein